MAEFNCEYRCQVATELGTRVVFVRAASSEGARDAAARWWRVEPEAVTVTPVELPGRVT